jgi:hypothetical protein
MDIVTERLEFDITMPDLEEFMTTQEASAKLDLTIRAVTRLVTGKKTGRDQGWQNASHIPYVREVLS